MDVIKIYKNQRIFRMNESAINIKKYIDNYIEICTSKNTNVLVKSNV